MILTEKEQTTIKSMAQYWNEVSKRTDTSPLTFELQQVFQMFGLKILWVLEDYVNNSPKEVK